MSAIANFDVVRVLSFGTVGLVFLLAGLSYRLLVKARDGNASPAYLTEIRRFGWMMLALIVIASVLELGKAYLASHSARTLRTASAAIAPMAATSPLWINSRIEDAEGRPIQGATVLVTELDDVGNKRKLAEEVSSESGSVNFKVVLTDGRKVKIEMRSPGLLGQELILQQGALTLPTRLTRISSGAETR